MTTDQDLTNSHYCPTDFKNGCLIIGKSLTPHRFKGLWNWGWGGCETGPFPSFSRRGVPSFSRGGGCAINKKIPFLSGTDGVVRNFKQNKDRYAACTEATRLFTNHPRSLRGLLSFERRGMNSLQQRSSISKLLASGNNQKSDVYANYNLNSHPRTQAHFAVLPRMRIEN